MERILCLFLCLACNLAAQESPLTLKQGVEEITTHISQPKFERATWGIEVQSLATGKILFEANSRKLLKPASNNKLYTAAMVLDRFGPDYRIATSLYSQAKSDKKGVLKGDLFIYGRGDFSMAARFNNGNYEPILEPVLKAIQTAGIKRVRGDLVGDATYFRGPQMGSGWSWDDLEYYYGAETSALSVQDNVVDLWIDPGKTIGSSCSIRMEPETSYLRFINRSATVRNGSRTISLFRPLGRNEVYMDGELKLQDKTWVDSITVPNPALWYVSLIRESGAVKVDGKLRSRAWPADEPLRTEQLNELAHFDSPPLSDLLPKMLKPSQNLYAQLLFLHTGANSLDAEKGRATTEELGVREMRRFLGKAGIDRNEAHIEEGSGLSRTTLVTPHASVQLLRYMYGHKYGQVYFNSLPVPGGEGTLRNRLKDLRGNLVAKTGSLSYVYTLSGYMKTAGGEPIAFSIMLNAYNSKDGRSGRDELDVIPRVLAKIGAIPE